MQGRDDVSSAPNHGADTAKKAPDSPSAALAKAPAREEILHEGRFLQTMRVGHWEYVRRKNSTGIVIIVALTSDDEMIFVEQYRRPVGTRVIELPAGLAGDIVGQEHEALAIAAGRELEEETGYRAARIEELVMGPVSAGLTSEVVTFFRAHDLTRVSDGGGDEHEDIEVHRIPRTAVVAWLAERARAGVMVDAKVFAALYFLSEAYLNATLEPAG